MKHTIFFLALVIIIISCEKDGPKPNYISLDDPNGVIASISPGNKVSCVATNTEPIIKFNYSISDITSSNTYLKFDSISLSGEESPVAIQLSEPDYMSLKITNVDSLEMGETYTVYLKAHLMIKEGGHWIDNAPNGSIEYYEYNFVFQTLLPEIIPILYPENNDNSVSIYTVPSTLFDFPLDSTIYLEDTDDPFQLKLEYFRLSNNNQNISGDIVISGNKALFYPDEWLPTGSTITMETKATWQKLVNGTWISCSDLDDNEICKIEEISFKITGTQILLIDEDIIEATYPVYRQYHFLKSEYEYGYVLFHEPADNIFVSSLDGTNCTYKAIISENQSTEKYVQDVNYISIDKLARYTIPTSLKNETIYNIKLVRIANADTSLLYENNFRTSMFDTWQAKISAYAIPEVTTCGTWPYYYGQELNSGISIPDILAEGLDGAETIKGQYDAGVGLAKVDMLFEDNDFFDSFVNPNMYGSWTIDGFTPVLSRSNEPFGIPPIHSGLIMSDESTLLTDENIVTNVSEPLKHIVLALYAYNQHFIYYDILDIQNQIRNHFTYEEINENEKLKQINNYPDRKYYEPGEYVLQIYYMLPGINIITSEKKTIIFNYVIK